MAQANLQARNNAVSLRSLSRRQIVLTMVGVMLAMFLGSLDQTVVGTAMPRIIADLGGFAHYTWITTAYLVTSTVVLPIMGKLTDMYGRKYFYIAGLGIFILGSLLCGLSQTMTQIIFFRGFQGIGAGIMVANAFTVVADLFPPAERGKYVGLVSGVFGLSSIIGPTLGGFITDSLSWHWVFYINIPLGIITIVLFALFFPNLRPDSLKHHVDYAGMSALVIAVVPLLLALSWGGVEYPWLSAPVLGMLALSVVAAVIFFIIESRSEEPLLPLGVFKNGIVAISMAVIFFTGLGMFGSIIFVPLFFQGVLGLSATASGSFLTPMMLGVVFGSFVSGQALSRAGGHYRIQGIFGLAIMALGMGLLSRMSPDTSYVRAVVNIMVVGFGLGITMPIYMIAIQNAVPYNVMGVATSMGAFSRSMGGSFGLAILGSVMTSRFAAEFVGRLPAAVKAVLPPQLLNSVTHNAQVLISPEAQAQLKNLFSQLGQQGATLYEQTFRALREALSSALTGVFVIGLTVILGAFVVNLFLKEVPLRKQHTVINPPDARKSGVKNG